MGRLFESGLTINSLLNVRRILEPNLKLKIEENSS